MARESAGRPDRPAPAEALSRAFDDSMNALLHELIELEDRLYPVLAASDEHGLLADDEIPLGPDVPSNVGAVDRLSSKEPQPPGTVPPRAMFNLTDALTAQHGKLDVARKILGSLKQRLTI